ncbi:MAG: hypothetical protein JO209_08135 [Acidisphaera sp.]|nr:hypothetical protein [Acidisphaera sp.]
MVDAVTFPLQRNLEQIKADHQLALERAKLDLQKSLETHKEAEQHRLERYKAKHEWGRSRLNGALSYGSAGINMAMLINGAAVLGLLGFIGNLATKGDGAVPSDPHFSEAMVQACWWFCWGVALAAATQIVGYLGLTFSTETAGGRIARAARSTAPTLRYVAPFLAGASLLSFVFGSLQTMDGARFFLSIQSRHPAPPAAANPPPGDAVRLSIECVSPQRLPAAGQAAPGAGAWSRPGSRQRPG